MELHSLFRPFQNCLSRCATALLIINVVVVVVLVYADEQRP